jgi:hypothetical protein
MVKIKSACKNATIIPKRRLFEMNNKFYLIQFTVEDYSGFGEQGANDGGDENEDPGNDDDTRMDDF